MLCRSLAIAMRARQWSPPRILRWRGGFRAQVIVFCLQLKRGINGTHIHVSAKHLPKCLGEFEFRHNRRNRPETMLDELMLAFPR